MVYFNKSQVFKTTDGISLGFEEGTMLGTILALWSTSGGALLGNCAQKSLSLVKIRFSSPEGQIYKLNFFI